MPQQSKPDPPPGLAAATPSEMSRRAFLGGTGALLAGSLWGRGTASAQTAAASGSAAMRNAAPVFSRAPLAPAPFAALPLGSIRAEGWLLQQLELQRDGLTGHAEEVLPATAPDNAWKGGAGEDWEKGPYYLKGLIPLAYTLGDDALKARAQAWIEPILASQRDDGFFGPTTNDDWWPRMVATYLLRDYAEATGDARVVPFLTRYYRHMSLHLPGRPLRDWGRARAGDEMDTIVWLYNRTGSEFLLPLLDLLARQAYPWREIFTENRFLEYGSDDFHPKHNVNVPQALKMPVVYWQRSGDDADREAYRRGITHLMRDHGTSFGIQSGTEMLAGRSTLEGVETCSLVEYMLSAETAIRILGDARIGDELELVAFNGLPAATSKDFHQHVYYTVSNNVTAPLGEVGYEQNYANARAPSPISGYPCCCYNLHMGWPKLAQNAWAATPDGGLAVMAYVPSRVTAPVAGGQTARIACDTQYPFEETVRLTVGLEKATPFPIQLRIPGWCADPEIRVNGDVQPGVVAGTFARLDRVWQDGDRVELTFPMHVEVVPGVKNAVSVRRGPLVYALGQDENWAAFAHHDVPGFDSYEVTTRSPWNFALVLDGQNPADAFTPVRKPGAANPFRTGGAPVALRVQARPVDAWKMRFDGLNALDPPLSPVATDAPAQTLELVPFGSQMLRVSTFPVAGTPPPPPKTWAEDFAGDYWQRWVVYLGSFVREGRLHLPFRAKGVAEGATFADCLFDADVVVGEKGDAGIVFRASDFSVGTDHYMGYYVGISAENDAVMFGKSNNAWQPIATASRKITSGETHRLRVEARGPQIRVWVDDMETPALEARDASFSTGALGVRSYSDQAVFGNLSAQTL